jgi:ATP-dependent DNA helicase 2 subunit 1
VHETKKGSFVWLDSRNNQPMKVLSRYVCEDTGTLLMDSQIKFSYLYGGERVIFDKEELQGIKVLDTHGTFKVVIFF